MTKNIALALVFALLSAVSLSACNTMEGAGKDVKAGGQGLENSAATNKGY